MNRPCLSVLATCLVLSLSPIANADIDTTPKADLTQPSQTTDNANEANHSQTVPGTFVRGALSIRPRLDIRLRGERRANLGLDRTASRVADLERLNLRAGLGADVSWRFLEFSVGATDGRELIHDKASNTAELDFTQLYLGIDHPGGIPLNVRVGRQIWNIGSKRLISSSSWSNRRRSWDGLMAKADFQNVTIQAFTGSVVEFEERNLDHGHFDEIVWGAFMSAKASASSTLEVFIYGLYRDAYQNPDSPIRGEDGRIGNENRVTPGFRAFGKFQNPKIDWEFEGAFQVGSRGKDSIHSFAFATGAGWTMPMKAKPRLALDVTFASGDPDATDGMEQTFVPIYGTTHSPYGIADLFRWQNIFEIEPSLTFHLTQTVTLRLEQHTYWLAETADEWVNSSGKVLRHGDGDESNYAGQEWSAVLTWKPSKNLTFEGGISRFIGGTLMRDTGDKTGATFGYLQAVFSH